MIIGRSSTKFLFFYAAKIHRLTLDPMGKMFQNAFFSETTWIIAKPNCGPGMIIGMSFTKLLLFMPIGNPRWPPPQDID